MSPMMIVDAHSNAITRGLQGPEVSDQARQVAQRLADERGESVWLVREGGEEEGEEFTPTQD